MINWLLEAAGVIEIKKTGATLQLHYIGLEEDERPQFA